MLNFNIRSNGFISSLPFLAQSFVCITAGWITDYILKKKEGQISTLTVRKFNTALGLLVPAATVVLAGYAGCKEVLAITFFVISVGFNTFTVPGCKTS